MLAELINVNETHERPDAGSGHASKSSCSTTVALHE